MAVAFHCLRFCFTLIFVKTGFLNVGHTGVSAASGKKFLAVSLAAALAGIAGVGAYYYPAVAENLVARVGAAVDVLPQRNAALVTMMPHRAVYDFKLVAVESGAQISGVQGNMYYEQADACDAIATEHRFSAEYQYPERPPVLNNSQYSSWESKDGRDFYFNSDLQENGMLTEQLRGSIEHDAENTATAVYARPEPMSYALPDGYYLPVAHTAEVIARARRGETVFNATVFDGTDADGPVEINTIIGAPATAAEVEAVIAAAKAARDKNTESASTATPDANTERPVVPQLKNLDAGLLPPIAWHVRMAVFPLFEAAEMLPAYEMDMLLHENGVVSKVLVDYRTFKVAQTLTALEPIETKNCRGS